MAWYHQWGEELPGFVALYHKDSGQGTVTLVSGMDLPLLEDGGGLIACCLCRAVGEWGL